MSRPLFAEDLRHVLDHTRDMWEDLRGGRIFVTGGTGFFGCWLLETFLFANDELGLNAELVALTRNPKVFRQRERHLAANMAITLHQGDVRNFEFPGGNFTHVIHAGTTSSAPVEPKEMFDTIVQGTERTFEFASARKVEKVLFTSSGAVYGRQPPGLECIPETYAGTNDPADPQYSYAEGKRWAEVLCSSQAGAKIARCFAFVGPHLPLNAHFAIGNFICDALAGSAIRVKGDGTPLRSYLYAADLAIWLWTILFRGRVHRAYNVGSGEAISIADLAKLVAGTLESGAKVEIAEKANPSVLPARYVPDVRRAASELDLRALIPLNEAVKRAARWHQPA
jgi:dTDP-glucose 4,6-dehydratase